MDTSTSGLKGGTLVVSSDDPDRPNGNVALSGTGLDSARYDPTKMFASGVCQAFAGEEARSIDSLATGWRCSRPSERLVIEISPSCATATGRNGCVLVQISAQWDDAVIE